MIELPQGVAPAPSHGASASWLVVLCVASLGVLGRCHVPNPTRATSFATFERGIQQIQLPFIVYAANPPRPIYANSLVGLKLERVTADGRLIAPTRYDFCPDELDIRPFALQEGMYGFVLTSFSPWPDSDARTWDLVTVDVITDDDYNFVMHSIPWESKDIEIRYRVRYADNSLGPLLTLRARARDYLPPDDQHD